MPADTTVDEISLADPTQQLGHSGLTEASLTEWTTRVRARLDDANGAEMKYGGNASMLGLIYGKLWINITDGAHRASFEGDAGGAGGGVGVWFGELYTDDIERVYRDTLSFSVVIAGVYMNAVFFDGNSRILGHFHGGGPALAGLSGGGKGHWTKK